jgi:hypothetical protein
MKVSCRVLVAAGCFALLSLTCGFAPNPSHNVDENIIVTAAPTYRSLAALQGGERFPDGSHLLIIRGGAATSFVPDFAASADANVSFDGSSVLFSGKKNVSDPWQIWEMNLSDRGVHRVVNSASDAIRPFYLPGWRIVFAQRSAGRFQLQSARLKDSKAIEEIEGKGIEPVFPISFMRSSAIPADVLADGRILFESGFPLGEGDSPELFLVYSDGSGVESYRCDHSPLARWGGRQVHSGDVVFTQGSTLAHFTSPLAHEERVVAPRADYAGAIAETASGEWLVSARTSSAAGYGLHLWRPGELKLRPLITEAGENLLDPVVVAPRNRPRRHPSALHDWDYGNLLALDARMSRDGAMDSAPARVRLETQDTSGHPVAMGTAAVEPDGSFFVKAPADRAIRFALLDAKGNVIRQEHGWFWIRRGEQRYCVGCHAGPEHAAENRVPLVLMNSTTPADLTGTVSRPEKGGN